MARSLTSYLNKNVENEQYYPATHQHIHQHYSNQQQQQQQHHEQTVVSTQQHCNLHKGIVGKQQQHVHYPKHLQEQQQPQMRPEYQQQQQHHQQYQNIGTWLPQNKPTLSTTTNMNGKIDDLKHHRHHAEQQHQQQSHHHHHQQQQIPSNYCSKRLDSNIANGRNSCLIEDVESDFIIGKTFITPPDIPSPPPQPILSDNKRFQSGQQTPGKTPTITATASTFASKNTSCCQCEGRLKNLHNTNHTPLPQHHNNHCHLHQQQQQQQQQHQPSLNQTPASQQTAAHHLNNLPHQYQHQQQQQQQHHLQQPHHLQQQQHNEETLILPKASSALKSQHYHNQQQQQQHQQFHQHPIASQQHYRKVDVFAAASLDDDDNDTSPSIKNLVYSPQKLRRVRIILSVVGGIVLLALLATALYFIISSSEETINDDNNNAPSKAIHLEDVLEGKLAAKHFNGSWTTGNTIIYKENNAIMEYNVLEKKKTRLMLDTSRQYILYEKSADGKYLLLAKNYKKNFRHSFIADYDIYDIETGVIKPLTIQGSAKSLIMVQWAPVDNALIINYDRNLYYKPSAFANEIALTDDTNPAILNGLQFRI